MKRISSKLAAIAILTALPGCQYVTFYKTNTTEAPGNFQSSAEVTCEAMGAEPGSASLDWCVAEEEQARANRVRY